VLYSGGKEVEMAVEAVFVSLSGWVEYIGL